jgi:uncharacterized membrane protein (TIGR02234 family)
MGDAAAPRRRTSFGPTVLVGIAGAALAATGATQPWAEATTRTPGLRTAVADGTDVAALALPLSLVALAAWGTVLVLRARGRRVVSLIGLAAAAGTLVVLLVNARTAPDVAAELLGDVPDATTDPTAWPLVTGAGALLSAVLSAVAVRRAPEWPEMSSRYDAPGRDSTKAGPMSDADLWKAMDEGHDPTT